MTLAFMAVPFMAFMAFMAFMVVFIGMAIAGKVAKDRGHDSGVGFWDRTGAEKRFGFD